MKPRLLHLLALTGFAVAQPIYDVLSKSAEFFVAHRADRLDILLLVFWLSLAIPLAAFALAWSAGRIHRHAGPIAMAVLVGLFVTAAVLPVVASVRRVGPIEATIVSAMHGAIAMLLYVRFSAIREFASFLAAAAAIFPLWFLVGPGMRPLMRPAPVADASIDIPGDTPVVFVIFDQLPLTSLLDGSGAIDRAAYPGFAAFAADAIWYRNATTVADFTGWAIPALLTGNYPRAGGLPVASTYPQNLFTTFGRRYRIHALEPITDLCPDALCPEAGENRVERQRSMLADLVVVFQRIVLPDAWTVRLPRLSENWRNFSSGDALQERWVTARDQDRVAPVREFIDSIEASDAQPALYFAHVLLPHEPYVYLADEQQFSTESGLIGLDERGWWPADPWFATQTYRQHLEQVGCADALVASLIQRLKHEGLYDRALIVITSDHGVAFRPRLPMKGYTASTASDVVPVPLLIKPPHHPRGELSDRNVQSIDVLPTIASLLDVRLPFHTEGLTTGSNVPPATDKMVFFEGANRSEHLPASLWDRVLESARRKAAIFGASSHANLWLPADAPFKELLGRRVDELHVAGKSALDVELPSAWMFAQVQTRGPLLPARVRGIIHGEAADSPVFLAVAVNGVVSAVTKSLGGPSAGAGLWAALVPPERFRDGSNPIDVFEIATEDHETVLRTALRASTLPDAMNLVSGQAKYDWNVRDAGLYSREQSGGNVFRWTNGDASLTIARNLVPAHPRLAIHLTDTARPGTPFSVVLNGCSLFDGVLPGGDWSQTFPTTGCPSSTFEGTDVVIRLRSGTVPAPPSDGRSLGVPVAGVSFSSDETRSSGG